jgi:hypothetical protein
MFQGINWRRIFIDLGWAMAVADPLCYSCYLAYRAQSTAPGRADDVGEPRVFTHRLKFETRAPFKALSHE